MSDNQKKGKIIEDFSIPDATSDTNIAVEK